MLSWKRPENVAKIIPELRKNELIDDIIVWNNNPDEKLSFLKSIEGVTVITPVADLGMNTRWYAAGVLTKHDTIYMQDDDLIVSNGAIKNLHSEWKKDPEVIHGIWGRSCKFNRYWAITNAYPEAEMILPRSVIFHKKYTRKFFKKIATFEKDMLELAKKGMEDICFSYLVMSETGRKNRTHKFFKEVEELPSHHSIKKRPKHWANRTRMMRYCRKEFGIDKGRFGVGGQLRAIPERIHK